MADSRATTTYDTGTPDRRRLAAAFPLLLLMALSGCSTSQQASAGKEPFFFIQIADPQIPWGPAELWDKAITEANRLEPDLVVVCGDLTHPVADKEQTRA